MVKLLPLPAELHEVALAGAVVARVAHEPAHAVELVVARE